MKRVQISFISLLLLAAAVAPVSVSAEDGEPKPKPKPKQAVIVLGMYEWMLADVLAHITGDELSVGSVTHSRRASYDDITRSSAVQAKVKALRRGASADLSDLCTWGKTQNLSRICLVRATPQNTFSAQLIYVKSKIVLCTDSYASGDLSIDQSAVPLKKTAWVLAERLQNGSCTLTILDHKPDIEPEVVFVKGGKFEMGCKPGRDDKNNQKCRTDETLHNVTVSDFLIGKYAVTWTQWCKIPVNKCTTTSQVPVEVSHNQIGTYLNALNAQLKTAGINREYRLPTEAEWEYAARGGAKSKGYMYSGSDDIDTVAWHNGNVSTKTKQPIGGKASNELGIFDMSGNSWDFCSDWYGASYYSASNNTTDPTGPLIGSYRVARGGSWYEASPNNLMWPRVASRTQIAPDHVRYDVPCTGFRVVLALP
jgi:formylglycine-generating enzyme required for sulfatase activity